MSRPPYHTETTEVDPDTWAREAGDDVERFVRECVAAARRMLADKGYDLSRALPLLHGDTDPNGDVEAHLAAGVLLQAARMAHAVERGAILDVRRHAMIFAADVERLNHLAVWWLTVERAQEIREAQQTAGRDTANRRKPEHAAWRARAAELRAQHPDLSDSALAKLIDKRRWHTVRRIIAKS